MLNRNWYLCLLIPLALAIGPGCTRPAPSVSQSPATKPAADTAADSASQGETLTNNVAESGVLAPPAAPTPTSDSGPAESSPTDRNDALSRPGGIKPGAAPTVVDVSPVTNASTTASTSETTSGGDQPAEKGPRLPEFPGASGIVGTEVGDLIPEIRGKDMDRKSFELSEYSGRVVMIDFWGDW